MSKIPAAILWDMDGTLIDTEPAWVIAEKELLKQHNADFKESDLTDWVGLGLWDIAEIIKARGVNLKADEIVNKLTNSVDQQIFSGNLNWRPGAVELLAQFVKMGFKNALVTMATRAQALKIVSYLPANTFDSITAGDDVIKPKPHPDPYLQGANSLQVNILDCVAIEDSITGVTSAAAAGAFVVGIPNLVDLSTAPYDILLNSLEDVSAHDIVEMFNKHKKIE